MKKLMYLSPVLFFLVSATQVFATGTVQGDICPGATSGSQYSYLCSLTIGAFIGGIITLLFVLAGIIALIYLVWGGIKWLTSGGDKGNIEAAQGHIVAAVIGLVIILISYVVLNLVWTFFFGTGLTNIVLPTIQGGNKQ